MIAALAVAMMTACGSTAQGTQDGADSVDVDSTSLAPAVVNSDSLKHTAAYIAQRIDTIYKYKSDRRFCSRRFRALDAEAEKLSQEQGLMYVDADHWIAGQDVDPDWRYWMRRVLTVNDSIATVEMNIHNFEDQKVVLDLLYERGDWFVDDFHTFYDEDGETRVVSEKEEIQRFIRECNFNTYQAKIETVYGRDFHIEKYIEAINAQTAEALSVAGDSLLFSEYALVDVDQDGEPEVCVRSKSQNLTAVFATGGTPELLATNDGTPEVVFYEKAADSFRQNLLDLVSFSDLKWHSLETINNKQ